MDIECIDISYSYESAAHMLADKGYVLIFAATKLHDRDGFQIVENLRTINSDFAVIMYGEELEKEDYKKAIRCKSLDVLSKPFEKKSIEQAMLRYFQVRELERVQLVKARERYTHLANDLIELSFIYAVLFNGELNWEIKNYQHMLNMSGMGYVIYISYDKDVLGIPLGYERLTKVLKKNVPLGYQSFISRESPKSLVLFVMEKYGMDRKRSRGTSEQNRYVDYIRKVFHEMFQIEIKIGVGSEKDIDKIAISYDEALRNIRSQSNGINEVSNSVEREQAKFYIELEQKFLTNIREGSQEALNTLNILLDLMESYSLIERKNKIMELYVMASHIARNEGKNENEYTNYMELGRQMYSLDADSINSWAYRSVAYIVKSLRDSLNSNSFQDIRKVLHYLDNHYDEDITLEEVSSILSLSPQYFSRVFHEKTGVTFVDYLTRVRIKKAKEWLTYSQSNVQEVCFKVGYKDPNYFTRVFKKTVGVTPRQYKAQKSV
jgi:YesN/AraC family two-component response regulator